MSSVTHQHAESLLARVRHLGPDGIQPGAPFVPLDDFALYYLLASEVARAALSDAGEGLCLCVDSRTAMKVDAVDAVHGVAEHVVVFGAMPASWAGANNVLSCPKDPGVDEQDLFLVAISPRFSVAIVCEQSATSFTGTWTATRYSVFRIADLLRQSAAVALPAGFSLGAERLHPEDASMACALRMMALLARHLTLRQRDITMDKDDLFSVLNILKAVSAKRRAHDILFVFVEQIARAVHIDRCSVVRVWGGDGVGHVLASHEDESITDLTIDLPKYPEIRRAMETRQKVVINDTRRDPLTRPFAAQLEQAGIHAILVIPVVLFDQNVGSFLLRATRIHGAFSLREISFCEIVAEAAANALERAHLFESIQRANERLEYLADTDGLTGLYNHRFFRERLESEFERARRYVLPLSCMIMDIDNFKKVNDTFGHLQGDCVLRGIATVTLRNARKSDTVARYGGEEFVVIMPQTGFEGARVQAERIRKEIAEAAYDGIPKDYQVTVSIGVAVFDVNTMLDCEALIRAADSALYQAKREGKNCVIMSQP